MKLGKFWALFLALIIVTGIVMTSGCVGPREEEANEEEDMRAQGLKLCETTNTYEPYNFTTGEWIIGGTNTQTQQNTQGTEDNQDTQTTTKKSTQTSTSTKTTTKTPSTAAACSHPGITTKYVGLDKASGKIIYDTYCSKCGEYMGRTLY